MKYLHDYQEQKQTLLFDKTKAFFAFGNDQFKEKRIKNVKYVSLGSGLICPKIHEEELSTGLKKIWLDAIKQDLKENGKEGIIKRELYNHEAFYTRGIEQTFEAIKCYNITEKEIWKVYYKEVKKIDFDNY